MGTIAYMSPEQARGEDVDHHSDIWSPGVISLMSGRILPEAETDALKTISLDPDHPDGLAGLAWYKAWAHYDWEGTASGMANRLAERQQFEEAIKIVAGIIALDSTLHARNTSCMQASEMWKTHYIGLKNIEENPFESSVTCHRTT